MNSYINANGYLSPSRKVIVFYIYIKLFPGFRNIWIMEKSRVRKHESLKAGWNCWRIRKDLYGHDPAPLIYHTRHICHIRGKLPQESKKDQRCVPDPAHISYTSYLSYKRENTAEKQKGPTMRPRLRASKPVSDVSRHQRACPSRSVVCTLSRFRRFEAIEREIERKWLKFYKIGWK